MLSSTQAKRLLNGNETHRGDCPECGGKNTLSISQVGGELLWSCYKVSCSVKGRVTSVRSTEDILRALGIRRTEDNYSAFEVPEYFTSIHAHNGAVEHFSPLFKRGVLPDVRYDPKQDRAVYLINRGGKAVDAIGRKLSKYGPKWFRYGHSGMSFMVRQEGVARCVVVEDIPSACIIGGSYNAMALLGTSLSDEDVLDLKGFDEVVFCLDPDAWHKGMEMADRVSAYTKAYSRQIPNDLKYYTVSQAKEIVDG